MTRSSRRAFSCAVLLIAILMGLLLWQLNSERLPKDGVIHSGSGTEYLQAPLSDEKIKNEDKKSRMSEARLREPPAKTPIISEDVSISSMDPLSDSGRITTAAIERLNLEEEEVGLLSRVIEQVKNEAADDLVNRLRLMEITRDSSGIHYHYYLYARPDRGKQLFDSALQSFKEIVDEERSRQLQNGIEAMDFAGKMGKQDVEIEFIVSERGATVKFSNYDPDTGALLRSGGSTLEAFQKKFGDFVEIPKRLSKE